MPSYKPDPYLYLLPQQPVQLFHSVLGQQATCLRKPKPYQMHRQRGPEALDITPNAPNVALAKE